MDNKQLKEILIQPPRPPIGISDNWNQIQLLQDESNKKKKEFLN